MFTTKSILKIVNSVNFPGASWESHYSDVNMRAMASQITRVPIACSIVCSYADQRNHQSSASLAFASGLHRWSVDSPHKGPVKRILFSFDDVILKSFYVNLFWFRSFVCMVWTYSLLMLFGRAHPSSKHVNCSVCCNTGYDNMIIISV